MILEEEGIRPCLDLFMSVFQGVYEGKQPDSRKKSVRVKYRGVLFECTVRFEDFFPTTINIKFLSGDKVNGASLLREEMDMICTRVVRDLCKIAKCVFENKDSSEYDLQAYTNDNMLIMFSTLINTEDPRLDIRCIMKSGHETIAYAGYTLNDQNAPCWSVIHIQDYEHRRDWRDKLLPLVMGTHPGLHIPKGYFTVSNFAMTTAMFMAASGADGKAIEGTLLFSYNARWKGDENQCMMSLDKCANCGLSRINL